MTRELLEKAARACGIELVWRDDGEAFHERPRGNPIPWNPAESSADMADMENTLELDGPYWNTDRVTYFAPYGTQSLKSNIYCEKFPDRTNKGAARRMAALRAAAAMGEGL